MLSRALSVVRGALALVALVASTQAGASFWSDVHTQGTQRGIINNQSIIPLFDVTQPGVINSTAYLQIPMGSGYARFNGQQIYAVMSKAWNLNDALSYSSRTKFYFSPTDPKCEGLTCTNILQQTANLSDKETYQNGSYVNGKVQVLGQNWFGVYWENGIHTDWACVGRPLNTWYFTANASHVDAEAAIDAGLKSLWARWGQDRTISCNSFGLFLTESTVLSDLALAFGELDRAGLKLSPDYVTLVDYVDPTSSCTTELGCVPGGTPGTGTPGTGTPGTGTPGTGTPPCTLPDGRPSGNPYDCAPTDSETNCSLIDIPCNFKKLLIPRSDFLSSKLENGVGLTVKFPLTVADSWMTTLTFAGHTFPVGADFSTLTWNEETKDQFRFFAWWSTFLFLLGYLGVPFMGGKRGMADSAKDSTVGAAAREAAENDRAEAAYRSLRADDSWKNP